MKSVLAVDLGGTKTALAVIDELGKVRARAKVPACHTPEGTLEQIAVPGPDTPVDAVGIVVPGIYDRRAGTAWAPNLWGDRHIPLRKMVEQRLGVPAVLASDRTGYVLGEQWLGVARGCQDVVFVAVGTGIGVGIVAGGRVVEGAHGIAGAAGWMAIDRVWNPEYERCGCWETEAAGPAIARQAGLASAEAVLTAARAGDASARDILSRTGDALAAGIANLISLLDPEMVVLGGGVMQAHDILLPIIRSRMPRWAQPVAARLVRLELTALGEDAGLLGAARLALNYLEK